MTNSIATKIAKILAKADSTTSDTEAETFMAKAHQMMEEHGISLLDLGKLDSDDPVGGTDDAYTSSDGWKDKIAFKLATYYGAEIIMVPYGRSRRKYTIFGRESARITTQLMLPFVFKQIARFALEEYNDGRYPTPAKARTALANAMCIRLYWLTKEARKQTVETQGSSRAGALVPVDLTQQAVKERFPNTTPSRAKWTKTDSGAMRKAEQVSLNRQTPAPKNAKKLGAF